MPLPATLRGLLGPLSEHLDDVEVTELLVAGPRRVFVSRGGVTVSSAASLDEPRLRALADRVVRLLGSAARASEGRWAGPIDGHLEAVVVGAPRGPRAPVVRFARRVNAGATLASLVAGGVLDPSSHDLLRDACLDGLSIVVTGRRGSGKSELVAALAREHERTKKVALLEPHGGPFDAAGLGHVRLDPADGAADALVLGADVVVCDRPAPRALGALFLLGRPFVASLEAHDASVALTRLVATAVAADPEGGRVAAELLVEAAVDLVVELVRDAEHARVRTVFETAKERGLLAVRPVMSRRKMTHSPAEETVAPPAPPAASSLPSVDARERTRTPSGLTSPRDKKPLRRTPAPAVSLRSDRPDGAEKLERARAATPPARPNGVPPAVTRELGASPSPEPTRDLLVPKVPVDTPTEAADGRTSSDLSRPSIPAPHEEVVELATRADDDVGFDHPEQSEILAENLVSKSFVMALGAAPDDSQGVVVLDAKTINAYAEASSPHADDERSVEVPDADVSEAPVELGRAGRSIAPAVRPDPSEPPVAARSALSEIQRVRRQAAERATTVVGGEKAPARATLRPSSSRLASWASVSALDGTSPAEDGELDASEPRTASVIDPRELMTGSALALAADDGFRPAELDSTQAAELSEMVSGLSRVDAPGRLLGPRGASITVDPAEVIDGGLDEDPHARTRAGEIVGDDDFDIPETNLGGGPARPASTATRELAALDDAPGPFDEITPYSSLVDDGEAAGTADGARPASVMGGAASKLAAEARRRRRS